MTSDYARGRADALKEIAELARRTGMPTLRRFAEEIEALAQKEPFSD